MNFLAINSQSQIQFISEMVKLKGDLLTEAVIFCELAGIIAAIGGIVCTAKTCAAVMNGREFQVWELVKPIFIILLCRYFIIVPTVLDIVPNGVSAIASQQAATYVEEYRAPLQQVFRNLIEAENRKEKELMGNIDPDGAYTAGEVGGKISNGQAEGEHGTSIGSGFEPMTGKFKANIQSIKDTYVTIVSQDGFFAKMKSAVVGVFGGICRSFAGTVAQFFITLMNWVFPCVIGVAQVMLGLLALLGPFCLAFTAFPGLGGFKNWVVKYLHVSFWMPLTYMLYMVYGIGTKMFVSFSIDIDTSTLPETFSQLTGNVFALLLFNIIVFIEIFKIPTLASYVVDAGISSGLGGAAVKAKDVAKAALNRTPHGKAAMAAKNIISSPK